MDDENEKQFSVKWGNHHRTLVSVLEDLLHDETYIDCTISAEGKEIKAHKLVLSACSPYLNKLLKKHYDKHPILLLSNMTYDDLQSVIDYMYKGEVNVPHNQLTSFLKAGEFLQVTGLSDMYNTREGAKIQFRDDEEQFEEEFLLNEDDEVSNHSPAVKKRKHEAASMSEKDEDEELQTLNLEELQAVAEERNAIKVEQIEYISEQEDSQAGFDELNNSYKVFVIDDESGTLKQVQMDASEILANEKDNDGDDFQEIHDFLTENLTDKKGKFDKSISNRPRPKPKSFIHREDFNVNCATCGGLYKHEASYLNHLRHDCNQVHICPHCKKTFKNKRHLLDHVRDDCGKIHICVSCKKCFKQKVNLTTHMKHYCKTQRSSRQYSSAPPLTS